MSTLFHVTVLNGVFHPDEPVSFPEGTKLEFVAIPIKTTMNSGHDADKVEDRPIVTDCSSGFRAIVEKYAVATGVSLPEDFSREDIYRDDV